MVKARRGQASPQDQRPASASGGEAGHRSSVTPGPPGPHTTPSSPYSHGSDNTTQYLRMDNMISGDVRGKVRTASLEGSESDNSVRSVRSESDPGLADTPGQVAAISSTDPTPDTITGLAEAFKPPADISNNGSPGLNNLNHTNLSGGHQADTQEKPTKKKRKRCGECQGCQRKDNCGDCAPCRNEKSHQICKVRRCDRLTEKKVSRSYQSLDSHSKEQKLNFYEGYKMFYDMIFHRVIWTKPLQSSWKIFDQNMQHSNTFPSLPAGLNPVFQNKEVSDRSGQFYLILMCLVSSVKIFNF